MTILDKCKALVAEDKTEEAIALLADHDEAAIGPLGMYQRVLRLNRVGRVKQDDFFWWRSLINEFVLRAAATIPEPQPAKIDDLRSLLADLLPYFHDLETGFLEPKTQAEGYDRRTINALYTRLVEAVNTEA